ncbi:PREDICTED: uncharacterized acetyltransferase At3g50280-like [Ipomoea nil]|uniref:uncharacterized acetyltransferase At3g50280-like n=1 Tax=Ipomoea nil TaxID=35883 RepID=UPI00090168C5|nr:PREDICTED: uncharacterized acetyltransferase At3g50280-like [Ipomoea nil]XP_019153243.1 PREDICTED: uncharacterized acetyltransferase At3g50280-like [Ipomoea nil]
MDPPPPPPTVQFISECYITPKPSSEASKKPVFLSVWDLAMLSVHYIQKGLLFAKPPSFDLTTFLHSLKHSLSLTLLHFYPLAGRLSTAKGEDGADGYTVFIDCENSPGARFVQASLHLTIADILSPRDVPLIVQSFFDHHRAINHDGHGRSLLTIQVTELIDGIFLGCSMNHTVGDGTSFWNFLNTFSEIFRANNHQNPISRQPIHDRWFPENHGPVLNLPFTHHDQFISRHEAPPLRERVFHFSPESLAKLKARANQECNAATSKISSLQSLSAHVWRCITRARNFPATTITSCRMAINNRSRLDPPLSNDYFGNYGQTVRGTAAAGELLERGLGWAAWKLHRAVASHDDAVIREWVNAWFESAFVYQLGQFFDPCSVMMGSSPRFDMYGVEFGLGKAVAIRSGYANKFDGKVSLYPGVEGGGSMDLEICLSPQSMGALESDMEFMDTVA